MCGSRKPGGGRGSGRNPRPGDSGSTWLARGRLRGSRGRPRVGAHLAGSVPGVNPHCPGQGSGQTSSVARRRLVLICIYAPEGCLYIDIAPCAPSFF
eukprot:scaffold127434_cov57-Phaeocystis_antarctica.AAC.3